MGLDLGDRCSWYCVLDESGTVVLEQRVSTTAKALREVFGGMPRSRVALETGMLARVGDSHRAKTLAEELRKEYPTNTLLKQYYLPVIDSAVELTERNSSQAIVD